MLLLTPLALLALLPWAALVAWSLVRRGGTVAVPFVALWPADAIAAKRRGWRAPPRPVVLLLAAALLAILAATGPTLRGERRGVSVIIDRGATQSVGLRYRSTGERVLAELTARGFEPQWTAVPAVTGDPIDRLAALPPTALDTRELLIAAITDARQRAGNAAVVVVTDQELPASVLGDAAQVAPEAVPDRVTIAHVAARATPRAQVMVRLRNASDQSAVRLTVISADQTTAHRADLGPRGSTRDAFFDVPALGETIAVAIDGDGDTDGDGDLGSRAYLARQATWPTVRALGPVPPAVGRVIAAYARARPAGSAANVVTVTTDDAATPSRSILIGQGEPSSLAGAVQVVADPLTGDVDWPALTAGATLAGEPPAGFRALVSVGARTVLAVAPPDADGTPRAWIGLQAPADAQSFDWAVAWTHLFDHLNGDAPTDYAASPPQQLSDGWQLLAGDRAPASAAPGLWPGLYAHADGRRLAITAPDVSPRAAATPPDWADRLSTSTVRANGTPLASGLLLGALSLLALATATAAFKPRA